MKLLFAIKTLKQVKGGAERVFAELVSGLARRGHNVSICTFDSEQGETLYPIDPRIKQIHIGVGSTGERTRIIDFIMRLPGLRKVIREVNPDVVVGFTHAMYVPLSVAMIGIPIPLLASEHIVPAYYQHRRMQFLLLRLSAYLVDRFSVLSEKIGELYPSSLKSKLVVLPNSVTPARRYADPAGEEAGTKIILNVGRLVDFKDHKTLIDAFSLLADRYTDWNLRIIGEGHLRGELERAVVKYELTDRVFMPGIRENISAEYARAHIFVVSSLYEGFGLVTAEAASHGLPCIGFIDCPGTNEIIVNGETGLLVEPGKRAEHLAAAIEELISDSDKRAIMGETGKRRMKLYEPERVYELWEKELQAMLR